MLPSCKLLMILWRKRKRKRKTRRRMRVEMGRKKRVLRQTVLGALPSLRRWRIRWTSLSPVPDERERFRISRSRMQASRPSTGR